MGIFDFLKSDKIKRDYYKNGKIQTEISYKNWKLEWSKLYYKNGHVEKEYNFKDGQAEGPHKWYHENGKLREEETYKNNKLNGPFKEYYKSGKLKREGSYKNGNNPHGIWKSYHKNGKLESETNWENGKCHGLSKSYYKNGKLKSELNKKNHKYDGVWKDYYENGQLKSETNYTDDQIHGICKRYYENGQLENEGNYKDGEKDGGSKWYHENGDIISKGEGLFIIKTDDSGKKTEYGLPPSLFKLSDLELVCGKFPRGFDNQKFKEWFDPEKNKTVIIRGSWIGMDLSMFTRESFDWNYKVHYEVKRLIKSNDNKTLDNWEPNEHEKEVLQKLVKESKEQLEKEKKYYEKGGVVIVETDNETGKEEEYKFHPSKNNLSDLKIVGEYVEQYGIPYDIVEESINREKNKTVITDGGVTNKHYEVKRGIGENMFLNKDDENDNSELRKLIPELSGHLNNKSYNGNPYNGIGYNLHKNGELFIEGRYKNGEKDGEWKTYYDNGQLDIIGRYNDGKMTGKFEFYYKDGVLSRETNYKNGKEDGLNIQWYHHGEREYEQIWENGELQSEKRWDEEGKEIIKTEDSEIQVSTPKSVLGPGEHKGDYKDGEKDGPWKFYFDNGQLICEENYVKGKREGLSKTYQENGNLSQEGNYKNDNQDGFWKWYHENGQVEREGNIKDDKQDGVWKDYYENGQLKTEFNFKDGDLISHKCWDEDGNETECE